ncbi:EI24 domain-containing protein [Streptomyces antimicrobicus]|uniref:EI24 domain-containing protein n=1 Tax=Streptomyces antimicrobicus TaxID=2883108 RepID=A0ABS8B8K1_9ACTN|nr:EI24 domain-containing protein [Streptomyces antimicrobicus]MCB5180940.1 EI24 domain-containing protein [Streptomyces antimicrobicus]
MGDLGRGFGHLMAGQRWVARHGRWFGFGLLPGLVSLVLYAGALVGLGYGADDLVSWATPFADGWGSPWLGLFRGFLTALLFSLGLFLSVITFTAVTLLIGEPFYESLSEQVDRTEGGEVPESGLSLGRELWISARDSVRLLVRVVCYGIVLFALGFIPVIGQTVVPVIGFCVSGFFLSVELTSVALQRRRAELPERLALLRSHRAMALGFGVPLVLAFLVPLVAVFLMPGAVAGATLMVRELTGAEPAGGDRTDAGPAAGPHQAPPPAAAGGPAPYPAAPPQHGFGPAPAPFQDPRQG